MEYRYTYDGRQYTSENYNIVLRVLILQSGMLPKYYPPPQDAVCFVNPNQPDEAFLDVEWKKRDILLDLLFAPVSLLIISLFLACRFCISLFRGRSGEYWED